MDAALGGVSPVTLDYLSGRMSGAPVQTTTRRVGDLSGLFADQNAWRKADPSKVAYVVQHWSPVPDGTPGGLFFGNTFLEPGDIAGEYFMTKGHYHSKADAAEYYWCISGEGLLLLMDRNRHTRAEQMRPGSLHYIPGNTAHRTVNTGSTTLVFQACWPADAGHDYASIQAMGFSKRVMNIDGVPRLV